MFKIVYLSTLLKFFFNLPEKIRYLLVGGFNTITSYGIFVVLNHLMSNHHYNLTLLIQYLLTINISYLTMKIFVFHTKSFTLKEYTKVFSTYLATYPANALLLFWLIKYLYINVLMAQAIAIIIIAIATYILHKRVNYTHK